MLDDINKPSKGTELMNELEKNKDNINNYAGFIKNNKETIN